MIRMKVEDVQAFASKAPLFQGLSKKECEAICAAMNYRKFAADEIIVHEEDNESQTFFIIVSGSVHVTVITPEGKKTILATLKRGDFFGEMSILDGEPRSASVVAAEECGLFMLYRRQLLDILQKYPKMTIQMLVTMSRRLRRSNRHINTLSMMSVYGRVAEVILQIARDNGRHVGDIIVIDNPPTQREIAEIAGTSRETVSRVLSQLRKKRYLTKERKRLVILDEEKLYY